MSSTKVSEMTGQGFVHGVYSLVNPQIGTTRNGEPFLKCLLRDATGEAIGRLWRFDPATMPDITATGFVRIEGSQEMYQEKLQIKIGEIWSHEPSSDELTDLLPSTRKNIDEMFSEVTNLLTTLEHPAAKALGAAYLDDADMMRDFRVAPAAMQIHHAWIGGLLEHTLQLMKLADAMLPNYPRLNRDIILISLFIHDMGKIEELRWDRGFEYTREGNLIGHIARGAMWLESKAKIAEDNLGEPLPDGFLTVMQHIVLSHHGLLEHGAAKLPSTPEAIFVSQLDNLDAHTQTALDCARPWVQTAVGDEAFTERLWSLNTKLFRRDPLNTS
ncbi:MAG TPA: HD domain-containing protein [Phycisphaerales bacterium]|nr:HD domain-containing protein [Phycisphaerales bacterium]HIB49831.1 HD domain-containing protein [Phycisphaerales bacterium]HIN83828.1 HD domain-containing protein [Phycisphaerales bacterium]HIO20647.1 HD domain-containing protein [Phycisphaerales bacterium]HIO52089.1 HD domain-containing protein [Phycisphaerales bacterium]